jgi:hypothetical protein
MVKRLKKNPEDGERQPPAEGGAGLASGDGWDAQQQATVTATSGGVASPCQLNGENPAQRKGGKPS